MPSSPPETRPARGIQRREFLLSAAVPAARPATAIRIAFLGGGHAHAAAKVELAGQSPDWELVGIAEPDPSILELYTRRGVRALTREQVLRDVSIRAVAVESLVEHLAANAIAALEAGKHIHLDKPPAVAMRDMRRIVELAGRKRLLVQVGYMWRYNPAVNAALEAARAGWLGEVFQLRGIINTLLPPPERAKVGRQKGGQMLELGGHLVDPMVRLMGRPEHVTPFLRHDSSQGDRLADNTLAVIEWKHAIATLCSASMQPRAMPYRALEIAGTKGTALVAPLEPPTLKIDLAVAAGPYKAGAQTLTWRYRRYVDDFAEFAAAVRGEAKLRVTPAEDLLVEETLLRASGMAK